MLPSHPVVSLDVVHTLVSNNFFFLPVLTPLPSSYHFCDLLSQLFLLIPVTAPQLPRISFLTLCPRISFCNPDAKPGLLYRSTAPHKFQEHPVSALPSTPPPLPPFPPSIVLTFMVPMRKSN